MKLEINQVAFIKEAVESVNIKASDAPNVAELISKIDKEYERQLKLQKKNAPEVQA